MKFIRPSNVVSSTSSFTRAGTTATYFDRLGVLTVAAANTPRITYDPSIQLADGSYGYVGFLLENSAENILLQSTTLSTQIVSVLSSTTYTISFRGSGTIYFSGGYSGDPLVGTSTNSLNSRTFTTTSTSLTVTVLGIVNYAQLELGLVATSFIPTTTIPITRPADVIVGDTYSLVHTSLDNSLNLLTHSYVLIDQSLYNMETKPYILSFYGTGTVTVSGIGLTVPLVLVGLGETIRVTGVVQPSSSTTLAFTVAGTVTNAQFERGRVATGYTPSDLWDASIDYPIGAQVVRITNSNEYKIYERVTAGIDAVTPEVDVLVVSPAVPKWLEVGYTNQWNLFDQQIGTSTSAINSMTYLLKPGRINSLALLDLDASLVEVSLVLPVVPGSTDSNIVYAARNDLISKDNIGNWYQYFYEPDYQKDTIVITNLVDTSLLDIPAYSEGILAVTISKPALPDDIVSCGVMVPGVSLDLGYTQSQPTIGITDYSRKETNEFGNSVVVQRRYSKRMSAKVMFPSVEVDSIARVLAQYRTTPLVWVGAENLYTSLIIYGFYKDWEISIDNILYSSCNLQIEGLT